MSGRPWWRLAHRLGRVPAWLVPAVLALALAVPRSAGEQDQRDPPRILDGTIFGPMVPLAQS